MIASPAGPPRIAASVKARAVRFAIRPLSSQADYLACVALQRATWGAAFSDVVPPSILRVSQRLGGVAAGAFAADGELVGFVYGLAGWEDGRPVHWSDMLAVRPEARNHGVGRALKEYQRDAVRKLGVEVIYWTYDPLVARNAHLNFNVFGVRVVEYVENMYGETDSDLHRGIGTDRFVVAWDVGRREEGGGRRGDAGRVARDAWERRVEIPMDINAVQLLDPEAAAAWRARTRGEIVDALASGWTVAGFEVDAGAERGYYLLASETAVRDAVGEDRPAATTARAATTRDA